MVMPDADKRHARNCDGTGSQSFGVSWDPSVRTCPMRVIRDPQIASLLATWHAWREYRALPWPGGLTEQPAWLAEALMAMDREHAEILRERERATMAVGHG